MVKGDGKTSSGEPAADQSGKGQDAPRKSVPISKKRQLELITSLSPDDDERTVMSKKISWILRHGAKRIGIPQDPEDGGWIKLNDLLQVACMENAPLETVMNVITQSNAQKPRYELQETPEGTLIRGIKRHDRKGSMDGDVLQSLANEEDTTQPTTAVGDDKKPDSNAQSGLRVDAPVFVPMCAAVATYNAFATEQMKMLQSFPPMASGYPWPMPGYPPMPPGPPYGPAGVRYRGRIKSFNASKGFGFIESPEARAQYGHRHIYLHESVIGNLKVHDEVTFTVKTNKQGMPQARDLQGVAASSGRGKGKGGKGKGSQKTEDKGKEDKKKAGGHEQNDATDASTSADANVGAEKADTGDAANTSTAADTDATANAAVAVDASAAPNVATDATAPTDAA